MSKGVSNCTVIHTKTEASKRYDKKKVKRRIKRAKQCIGCEHNQEGFCKQFKNWCFNSQPTCSKCAQSRPNKPRSSPRKVN